MVNKMLGYVLAGAGLIIFFLSYSGIRALIGLTIPANVSDIYLTIAGVVLLLVGAFMAFKGTGKKVTEVPIYEGKEIVGYRVLGKK
jgi:hypothetical protein